MKLPLSLVTFVLSTALFSSRSAHSEQLTTNTEYDFIIIGGGKSGCTLADMLSQTAAFSVLLVEAGLDYTQESNQEKARVESIGNYYSGYKALQRNGASSEKSILTTFSFISTLDPFIVESGAVNRPNLTILCGSRVGKITTHAIAESLVATGIVLQTSQWRKAYTWTRKS